MKHDRFSTGIDHREVATRAGMLINNEYFQVKKWITFNEPPIITLTGYGEGGFAPGEKNLSVNQYIAARNLILAHAKTYHAYNDSRKENSSYDGIWFCVCWLAPPARGC